MFQTQKACPKCNGKGTIIDSPCKKCHGAGRIRKTATLTVDIPAGIDDRQIINARGQGNKGANGGPAGDLRIAVNVRPHPIFERDGYNVWVEMHISFPAAALGCELRFRLLTARLNTTYPQALRAERYLSLKTAVYRVLTAEVTATSLSELSLMFRES